GRTVPPPPPQRPVPDSGRPHRDPDLPGRHETQIAPGRTSPSGRVPEAGRGTDTGRPVPTPGWHDLATGEKPPFVPGDDRPGPARRPPYGVAPDSGRRPPYGGAPDAGLRSAPTPPPV